MYDLCIKNGLIVNAESCFKGNIYIKDGKIIAISEAAKIYEAKEILMPWATCNAWLYRFLSFKRPGYTNSEDFILAHVLLLQVVLQRFWNII